MNRVRREEESFGDYRESLKQEAKVMKFRLKGRWVWKTFYPVDSMDDLPKNAVVYERSEEDGSMVQTTAFDPKNKQHFIKFPPYRAQPDSKRKTFSEQRAISARLLEIEDASTSTEESTTPEVNTGGA